MTSSVWHVGGPRVGPELSKLANHLIDGLYGSDFVDFLQVCDISVPASFLEHSTIGDGPYSDGLRRFVRRAIITHNFAARFHGFRSSWTGFATSCRESDEFVDLVERVRAVALSSGATAES